MNDLSCLVVSSDVSDGMIGWMITYYQGSAFAEFHIRQRILTVCEVVYQRGSVIELCIGGSNSPNAGRKISWMKFSSSVTVFKAEDITFQGHAVSTSTLLLACLPNRLNPSIKLVVC